MKLDRVKYVQVIFIVSKFILNRVSYVRFSTQTSRKLIGLRFSAIPYKKINLQIESFNYKAIVPPVKLSI